MSSSARRPLGPRLRAAGLTALAMALLAGCSSPGTSAKSDPGLKDYPRNFTGDAFMPERVKRVVLFPIWSGEIATEESAAALDAVFAAALERGSRFEVVLLPREDCRRRYGVESISSAAALPPGMLTELDRDFNAEGVLLVDLTAYRPYRPILLGLRAKLILFADARVAWACDDIFSASNPAILNGLAKFYRSAGAGNGSPPVNYTEAALISPSRFADYAATAMFATLPRRPSSIAAGSSRLEHAATDSEPRPPTP